MHALWNISSFPPILWILWYSGSRYEWDGLRDLVSFGVPCCHQQHRNKILNTKPWMAGCFRGPFAYFFFLLPFACLVLLSIPSTFPSITAAEVSSSASAIPSLPASALSSGSPCMLVLHHQHLPPSSLCCILFYTGFGWTEVPSLIRIRSSRWVHMTLLMYNVGWDLGNHLCMYDPMHFCLVCTSLQNNHFVVKNCIF